MAKKKSNAQIQRLIKRAASRGEEYTPSTTNDDKDNQENTKSEVKPRDGDNAKTTKNTVSSGGDNNKDTNKTNKKLANAAWKLKQVLEEVQNDESLRAKERRSQRRKAEAIAAEEAGCTVEEMQKWYEENENILEQLVDQKVTKTNKNKNKDTKNENDSHHRTPYILFVGQLSFKTTKDSLFEHIQKELGAEHKVTQDNVQVRLLTDAKTQKSRGMAFVELSDPELMYACLKLHHTLLDGRRLNMERSAGGRSKETRQTKIKQFREKQEAYLSKVVDTILADYIKSGELQEGELDDGAIALCKRHSAGLVETAIKQYIENNGRTMDNTSAYFTFLLTKLATEKAEGEGEEPPRISKTDSHDKRKHSPATKGRQSSSTQGPPEKKHKAVSLVSSKSSLPGVDFSLSEKKDPSTNSAGSKDLSHIFPSLARGRGRGRGYM